jgi:hypothetical protein
MSLQITRIHENGFEEDHSVVDMPLDRMRDKVRAFTVPTMTQRTVYVFAAVGALTLLVGVFFGGDPFWAAVLFSGYYLAGTGVAALFFVAVQYLSGAGWSTVLRRVPEAMAAWILPGGAAVLFTILGHKTLWPWTHPGEHLVGFKAAWLDYPFFVFRTLLYIGVWVVFARRIVHHSRAQDRDAQLSHTQKNTRLAAVFTVLFALSVWLAAVDWVMSLEPHWYSTIFGAYNFAGHFVAALAAVTVLVLWLRRNSEMRLFLREDHLHDLGKLMLGMCTFWAYLWFSQYMLIWYADIPEETQYYLVRTGGTWGPLFLLNIFVNWAIPFLVLLPRQSKRNPAVIGKVAVLLLFGHGLDLYLMIFPAIRPEAPHPTLWEVGVFLGGFAVACMVLWRALRQALLMPINDPYLRESLHFHQ